MLLRLKLLPVHWQSRSHWEKLIWSFLAFVLVALCIRSFVINERRSVYPVFEYAAQQWLQGEEIYHNEQKLFRYSPLVAALFAPLSLLPTGWAGLLWRLANAVCCMTGWYAFSGQVLPSRLTSLQRATLLLFASPLLVLSLHNGQSNLFVLGLLLWSCVGVLQARWWLTSLCLAGAILFKLYPLAFALLLIALYPKQLGFRTLGCLLVGLAFPFLLAHPSYVSEQYLSWLHHLQNNDRQVPGHVALWYRDFRMLVNLARPGTLSQSGYLLVQAGTGALLMLYLWAGQAAGWSPRKLLTQLFHLCCCWMTVFGAATEGCTYSLVGPTLAWSLFAAWTVEKNIPRLSVSFCAALLFLLTTVSCWFPSTQFAEFGVLGQPLGTLLLIALCVWQAGPIQLRALLALPGSFSPK